MSQTTVAQYGAAALKGMLFDLVNKDTFSYAAEAAISPSRPVKLGTDKEKQVLHADTGASAVGFAILHSDMQQSSSGVVDFDAKETVSVLKKGRIWVETNDAVTAGNTANLHLSSGKLTDDAVAVGIEAFTQIKVRFLTSTTAAGLAAVEVSQV